MQNVVYHRRQTIQVVFLRKKAWDIPNTFLRFKEWMVPHSPRVLQTALGVLRYSGKCAQAEIRRSMIIVLTLPPRKIERSGKSTFLAGVIMESLGEDLLLLLPVARVFQCTKTHDAQPNSRVDRQRLTSDWLVQLTAKRAAYLARTAWPTGRYTHLVLFTNLSHNDQAIRETVPFG